MGTATESLILALLSVAVPASIVGSTSASSCLQWLRRAVAVAGVGVFVANDGGNEHALPLAKALQAMAVLVATLRSTTMRATRGCARRRRCAHFSR